jgi:hypothetical protein
MAHDERTERIGAADDVVRKDPDLRLELVVPPAKLVKGGDRVVTGQ